MQGYPPDPKLGYIALFDFPAAGAPARQRWRFDFDHYTCFPTFLKTDLNADGVQDLVVQTHSRMWFFDARDGTVLQFLDWDVAPANIRSYGLTKFADLDRDGREDFLCIANFAQHHEVLLNRDGKMVKAWHHGWDESVTTGTVATRYPTIPDVDFDGDKRRDLFASVPDMLASTANYMKQKGWKAGQPWGEGTANHNVIREWNKAEVYVKTIAVMAEKVAGR